MKGLNLNFYYITVGVTLDSNALAMDLLAREVSCFKSTNGNYNSDFSFEIHLKNPPWNKVPVIITSMHT